MISALTLGVSLLLMQQESELTIHAAKLHVGDGQVLENADITIRDGRIVSVTGGGSANEGDLTEITPGLVDAFSFMGVGSQTLEQSRETTSSHAVSATADLDSVAFRYAAESGVTSAYLSPDSLNVFGGLGAFVKTAGGQSADLFAEVGGAARMVEPASALKIVLGADASRGNFQPRGRFTTSFYSRRPNTRMGTVWIIRRDFYRAMAYRDAKAAGEEVAHDADLEVLIDAMEGRIPVRFQARRSHDLQTALRLKEEFDLPNVVLEEATEGHIAAPVLAEAGVPVICGPAYDARSRAVARGVTASQLQLLADPPPICCEGLHENEDGEIVHHDEGGIDDFAADLLLLLAPRYGAASGFQSGRRTEGGDATPALAAHLAAAGVDFALAAAEAHDGPLSEASLIHQARTAVRWGLPAEDALPLITSRAAAICGMGDRVGKLESGFDADLVLWSGPPLDSSSRPLLVDVDGLVVLDLRSDS